MEITFSNFEILWSESAFPIALLLLSIGLLVFSLATYLFYTVKFRISFIGCIASVLITLSVIWSGSGSSSDLKLRINTFTKRIAAVDNKSKAEYSLGYEDLVGYSKQEYTKSSKNKSVIYHQLFLHLKNGAQFKLNESNDFSEFKTLMSQMQKQLDLPIFFSQKEIPKTPLRKKEFDSREICDFKFEQLKKERSEVSCALRWENKLPHYLYPIICIFFIGFFGWIDSIFLEGFKKAHFFWLIVISIFVVPFGYLALSKFRSTNVLKFDKEKITIQIEAAFFDKHTETSIRYANIKSFTAPIETMSDSFTISSIEPKEVYSLEELTNLQAYSDYLSFSVYGLPVVDKLRLCDLIKNATGF